MLGDEINRFLEQALNKSEAATELSNLIEGYSLCARSEGLSENTILLTGRAVGYLRNFLVRSQLLAKVDVNWRKRDPKFHSALEGSPCPSYSTGPG